MSEEVLSSQCQAIMGCVEPYQPIATNDLDCDNREDNSEMNDECTFSPHGEDAGDTVSCGKRRGEYGFYPPALRVRIAKMALEKGVGKTADYFTDDLGRYVSPSTVASIRNQYLKEVSQCIEEKVVQISELPKADTGRPLLLEELDSHIMQCVQKIRQSGGAINAVVIKRIARDIIIANNKSLLLEYGGPFELSTAWAERTLKRLTNCTPKKTRASKKPPTKFSLKSNSPGLEEMKRAYVDIITSAVTTHGLSKELIPTVDQQNGTERRRSQRHHVRVSTAAVEASVNAGELPRDSDSGSDHGSEYDVNDIPEDEVESAKSTNSKLLACPVNLGKAANRKRFRILKVPTRNLPRTCPQGPVNNGNRQSKDSAADNGSAGIPEEELIEMAIPCIAGKRKRGDYATYTSEQRIKMAKMALKVGVAKTAQQFTIELGRYVSPSSVASMRNQYRKEAEKSQSEVIELPKGKRGRPLLLGNLDSEIKHTIESIKANGGKVGRNIVKSVARDIILANNRGLLKEFGGPLQLTNTWAESVMKRMGFVRRRRSKPPSAKSNLPKVASKNAKGTNDFEELNQAYMDVLSNAVSSAVSTHGLTEDLISNYDQYSSHPVPSNHNFNPTHIVNHVPHSSATPSAVYHLDNMQINRSNPQTLLQPQNHDAVMGLGHMRSTPVEGFSVSAFNHTNSYYGSWAGGASRDFPMVMGSYCQPGNTPATYSSVLELPHMNQQHLSGPPLDRQSLANHVSLASVSASTYSISQVPEPHSTLQPGLLCHQLSNLNSRDAINVPQTLTAVQEPTPQMPVQGNELSNSSSNHVISSSEVQRESSEVINSLQHDTTQPPHSSNNDKGTSIVTSRTNETDAIKSPLSRQATSRERKAPSKSKKAKEVTRKRGEYGVYTAEQRMRMAKLALDHGVTKAANIVSGELGRVVSSSTVASMRNIYLRELEKTDEDINELPKGKRGRPLLLGDLDSQIQRCLMNIRINGGVITRMVVVSVARGIIMAKNKELLKEHGGPVELGTTWAESVIRRMGFVRQKTGGLQKAIPPDFENLKSAFLKRITTAVMTNSIPKELILNFGQTSLKIVPSSSWTTEGQCSQQQQQLPTIEIEDRREITTVLTVTLAGDLLPSQLIYTGKTDQSHPNVQFPEGWNVTHTENHLCTNETMMQFAEKLLVPYVIHTRALLGLVPSHKALVVFDVLSMNQDKDFFTRLRENNIEVVLVPTPCTSMLQPLELAVFGRFHDELYKLFVSWYSGEVCAAVRAGQNPSNVIVDLRLSVLKHLHAQWVLKTHDLIAHDRSLVLEGFGKAGVIDALSAVTRGFSQPHN